MSLSRRDLLKIAMKAGAGAAVLSGVPRPLLAEIGALPPESVQSIQDPLIKELALRAVQAAREAGASYADVRLTHSMHRNGGGDNHLETVAIGVRSLVDGYWGFASGQSWHPDEITRLARTSVRHARALGIGPVREVDLAPASMPVDEHWTMPVEIDPFEESRFEIGDYIGSLAYFIDAHRNFETDFIGAKFFRQDKAFASSEGAYCTQRVYRTEGAVKFSLSKNGRKAAGSLDTLTPAGLGWELFKNPPVPIRDQIRQLMEELEEEITLPIKPVEVGRYQVACDAQSIATLVNATLGRATQLDVALGYEANAGGTSYLNQPLEMLGSYETGAPLLTLTANRSERGGAATVAWDDEGVRPDEFTLVQNGVLTDFQTTRESAGWLADSYTKASRQIRSHGCAAAPRAIHAPLTHTPNLRVKPGSEAQDFDDMIAGIEEGLAVKNMHVHMDFQSLNGSAEGSVYEIKDGKRVARIVGAGFLFRSPELWKGLVALGGADSVRRYGTSASKGEPERAMFHSVSAPPAVFEEFTVIDPKRKA